MLHGGAIMSLADAAAGALHRGRTTIVVETDVRDSDDRLLARVAQTQAVLAT